MNCCSWDGVICDTETGYVIGLDLSCSCISGGIISSNSSLFRLRYLRKLNLAYNDFNLSSIPSELGKLSSLTHLNISFSKFSGIVPSVISCLPRLTSLDLSSNVRLKFEGYSFENFLGNMTQIKELSLCSVDMSLVAPSSFLNISSTITTLCIGSRNYGPRGEIPEDVFRFPYLQKLLLEGTDNDKLTFSLPKTNWSGPLKSLQVWSAYSLGEIPDSIGNLKSLEVLQIYDCKLNGSIPLSLGNLRELTFLDLSFNNLQGQIPDIFINLTKLSHLSLRNNRLSGHLPFSAFNLPQVKSLYFSENKLTGHLPYQVRGLSLLEFLILADNSLTGEMQSWLFTLSSLFILDLSHNKLSGPIDQVELPVSLGPIDIYLSNNEVHGPIPSVFFQLVNLTLLDLSSNKLSGIFESDKLLKLYNLEELDLSNNALLFLNNRSNASYTLPNLLSLKLSSCNISEFPDFVRDLEGLLELDLSYNKIKVIESDMFSKLKNLASLDLSHNNQLSFSTNNNVNLVLPNLFSLSFSSCNISKFPNFLPTLENLFDLDLSNNLLTSLEYYPWKNMEFLNLRSNLLKGPLLLPPNSIQVWLMSDNKLSGEIPSSVCNLSSLEILDLSDNNLRGTIPKCLGALNSLNILDLQRNEFYGHIPDSFVEGNMLQTISLNDNGFVGPLPTSLRNCSQLEVLNLGHNKINDRFPQWLGALQQLQVLVLRYNSFHGRVVLDFETPSPFPKLSLFELSHNGFSGSLPTSFHSFKAMMDLDNVGMRYVGDRFGHYRDSVAVTMKGADFQLERILIA